MLKAVPAGRMGEVEENANLAAYLLSDYSSWVSGAVIVLDGGNLPYMAGMFSQLTQVRAIFPSLSQQITFNYSFHLVSI